MGKGSRAWGNTQAKTLAPTEKGGRQWAVGNPSNRLIRGNAEIAPTAVLQVGYGTSHLAEDQCKVYHY